MNKVKFAYEWMGPLGPITNNESPNLLQLIAVSTDARPNPNTHIKYFSTSLDFQVGRHNTDLIDFVGVNFLESSDFFIYPFELTHKSSIYSIFTPEHSPGLLELSNLLSPCNKAMDGIKNGNGYILIHFAVEAYIDYEVFRRMHSYFQHHHIPLHKVIYQTGSPDAFRLYNEFCDMENVQSRMLVGFWDMNEYNLSREYKNDRYVGTYNFNTIIKTFLCLNRRYRWHRNALFALFYKYDLLKDSYFSMPQSHSDGIGQMWKDQCDMDFLTSHGLDANTLQQILPLRVDTASYTNMVHESNRAMKNFYETSLISVVTETTFDTQALQVSEKTYKPILYKIPFIIVNSPGALKYLQKSGYKTFSNFFDEGYDDIINPRERVERIANLCKTINDWTYQDKQKFFEETRNIVEYNYQVLIDVFPKQLKGEFWDFLRNNV